MTVPQSQWKSAVEVRWRRRPGQGFPMNRDYSFLGIGWRDYHWINYPPARLPPRRPPTGRDGQDKQMASVTPAVANISGRVVARIYYRGT